MADLAPARALRVVVVATQGSGSRDEARATYLLADFDVEHCPFDRRSRLRSAAGVLRRVRRVQPDVVFLEGTGLAGAFACMVACRRRRTQLVVSTGDAVAPYWKLKRRILSVPGLLFEVLLYRSAAGVIGWTPYLCGRALTLGARRVMTAENWAPPREQGRPEEEVLVTRERLGIRPDDIVFGIAGSLEWSSSARYSYGLELVRALGRTDRADVKVLIVGEGSGLERLKREADGRVIFTGKVARHQVRSLLLAMDAASLPQRLDGVGAYRYGTKLSEYIDARLPIVTGRLPLAYDLDDGWLWRLPGDRPWDARYIESLAALMGSIDRDDLAARRAAVPVGSERFEALRQRRATASFLVELVDDHASEAQR